MFFTFPRFVFLEKRKNEYRPVGRHMLLHEKKKFLSVAKLENDRSCRSEFHFRKKSPGLLPRNRFRDPVTKIATRAKKNRGFWKKTPEMIWIKFLTGYTDMVHETLHMFGMVILTRR